MINHLRIVGGLAVLALLLQARAVDAQVYAAQGYNPYTGNYARGAAGYNPYTGVGRTASQSYNPYTGNQRSSQSYDNT
jgi:hypothetical protein